MEKAEIGPDPATEAARAQLEAEAYDPVQVDRKRRAAALVYITNDVVRDAARELQAALGALVAYRAEHGTDNDPTGGRPTLEALRQIARLRRVCNEAEESISRALVLDHIAAPALAYYRDMPTYSLNEWAQEVWRSEGRSMYDREDEGI